jgi:hypothetical protein
VRSGWTNRVGLDWQAPAERLLGEFHRQVPRRVPERGGCSSAVSRPVPSSSAGDADYNQVRPHSAHQGLTAEAARLSSGGAPAAQPRPVRPGARYPRGTRAAMNNQHSLCRCGTDGEQVNRTFRGDTRRRDNTTCLRHHAHRFRRAIDPSFASSHPWGTSPRLAIVTNHPCGRDSIERAIAIQLRRIRL